MCKWLCLSFFIAVLICQTPNECSASDKLQRYFPDARDENYASVLPLKEFLYLIAREHDVKFTVEMLNEPEVSSLSIIHQPIEVQVLLKDSIDEILNSMQKVAQHKFEWQRSRIDPRIIHIVHHKLKNYVMDQIVQNCQYKGNPDGLVSYLHETFEKLIPMSSQSLVFYGSCDFWTPIDVSFSQVTIRELLASSVPFNGYNAIIWESQTEYHIMNALVGFNGPHQISPSRRIQTDHVPNRPTD